MEQQQAGTRCWVGAELGGDVYETEGDVARKARGVQGQQEEQEEVNGAKKLATVEEGWVLYGMCVRYFIEKGIQSLKFCPRGPILPFA